VNPPAPSGKVATPCFRGRKLSVRDPPLFQNYISFAFTSYCKLAQNSEECPEKCRRQAGRYEGSGAGLGGAWESKDIYDALHVGYTLPECACFTQVRDLTVGARGEEESRIALKKFRARFLAPLGMTCLTAFSRGLFTPPPPGGEWNGPPGPEAAALPGAKGPPFHSPTNNA